MAVLPHGGVLVNRQLSDAEAQARLETTLSNPSITIGHRELLDLELLATGAYSPLQGFMTRANYESVVDHMHLCDGLPWSLPITIAVSRQVAEPLREGSSVVLRDISGKPRGILELQE